MDRSDDNPYKKQCWIMIIVNMINMSPTQEGLRQYEKNSCVVTSIFHIADRVRNQGNSLPGLTNCYWIIGGSNKVLLQQQKYINMLLFCNEGIYI